MAAHRYWRVRGLKYVTAMAYSEVEMRDVVGGTDLCTGGTAIYSSQYDAIVGGTGFAGVNAFDDTTSTRWRSTDADTSAWIGYDFASPVSIVQIVLTSRVDAGATQSPTSHKLEWSDDGIDWSPESGFYVENTGTWTLGLTRTYVAGTGIGMKINKTTLQVVSGPSSVGIQVNKTTLQVVSGPEVAEVVGSWIPRITTFLLLS